MTAGSQAGTGSANVLFSFDANAGATRIGTFTVGGQTLTITQAGSTTTWPPKLRDGARLLGTE